MMQTGERDEIPHPSGRDAWFEGDILVVRQGGKIPTCTCIVCAEPAVDVVRNNYRDKKTKTEMKEVLGFLAFGFLFYLFHTPTQGRGGLTIGMCEECGLRQRFKTLCRCLPSAALLIATTFGFVYAMSPETGGPVGIWIAAGLLLCFIFSLPLITDKHYLKPVTIDEEVMRFSGAHPNFIANSREKTANLDH